MKKLIVVAAAAGLISLAACNKSTPAENASDNTAAALENTADNLEAAADNATDNAHAAANAAEEAGDNNVAVNAAEANAAAAKK